MISRLSYLWGVFICLAPMSWLRLFSHQRFSAELTSALSAIHFLLVTNIDFREPASARHLCCDSAKFSHV
jgi:hypothetical protein